MLQNVGHLLPRDKLLFIATDEKNKSFFDAFHAQYDKVRYLGDYFESAGLKDINPNYLGMCVRCLVHVVLLWLLLAGNYRQPHSYFSFLLLNFSVVF